MPSCRRTVPHLFNSYLPNIRCVVCVWHEADMPADGPDVRFRRWSERGRGGQDFRV